MVYIFFIIIAFFLVKDVRKTIIAYAPFKFFFITGTTLFWKFDIDVVISIMAFLLYAQKYKFELRSIPWMAGIAVSLVCYALHCMYPSMHLLVLIQRIFSVELYAVIFFCAIRSADDVKLFMKAVLVYALLLAGNGMVEFATGANVLGNIQGSMLREGTFISENDIERFIGRRVRSFVPHSIGFGVECACLLFFLVFLTLKSQMRIKKMFLVITVVCLAFGILSSGSRTPLLGSVLFVVPFIFGKKMNAKYMITVLTVFAVVYFAAGEYISNMLGSLFSENKGDDAGGSSVDMRQIQLDYSLYVFAQNPLWGQGPEFDIFSAGKQNEIMGAESVWFPILMKQGIIGIIGYSFIYIVFIKNVIKSRFKYFLIFFILGWLVIDSATNLPGITFFFPLMIATAIYKIDALNLCKAK